MKSSFLVALFCLLVCQPLLAQQQDYVLYFNGDSTAIGLDQPLTVQTKSGPVNVVLKQKQVRTYSDPFYSFQYPSRYTFTPAKIETGIEQVMAISAVGNGIIIQKYSSNNPEMIQHFMLDEITKESKAAGFAETKTELTKKLADGRVVKGLQSKLVWEDEVNIYNVYPVKIKNGGIIIIVMLTAPEEAADQELVNQFWNTLKVQ